RIDDAISRGVTRNITYGNDRVIDDADIRQKFRAAGSIYDGTAADDDVKMRGGIRIGTGSHQQKGDANGQKPGCGKVQYFRRANWLHGIVRRKRLLVTARENHDKSRRCLEGRIFDAELFKVTVIAFRIVD